MRGFLSWAPWLLFSALLALDLELRRRRGPWARDGRRRDLDRHALRPATLQRALDAALDPHRAAAQSHGDVASTGLRQGHPHGPRVHALERGPAERVVCRG